MSKAPPSAIALMFTPHHPRLPATTSGMIVINGCKITDARQIKRTERDPAKAEPLDADDLQRIDDLKREVERARNRQRYQRDRQDPVKAAARAAYVEAHRDELQRYKLQYRIDNRDRIRAVQASWAARQRVIDRDTFNARQRRYYERNREAIIARGKTQREARKGSSVNGHTDRARWTLARHQWLAAVASDPANRRARGQVGYQCMQFGWTAWVLDAAGHLTPHEQLTKAGRTVLAQWRASIDQPAAIAATTRTS